MTDRNFGQVTVDGRLFIDLNGAGRNLLGYLIAQYSDRVRLPDFFQIDKKEVMEFYKFVINESYARPLNVSRGIQNLIDNEVIVIMNENTNTYAFNATYICK